MEIEKTANFVYPQTVNAAAATEYYHDCFGNDISANGGGGDGVTTSKKADIIKKKAKKWSLSGLFKKRRSKSSDTDSSCETDGKKTGFLTRNSRRRRHNGGGSRKVVGEFEAIVLPKDNLSNARIRNGAPAHVNRCDGIELYDASPNVIKRNRCHYGDVSLFNRETKTRGSGGSLEAVARRSDKSKIKARAEAMRDRLRDESSSSDEQRPTSSSRNSNSSLSRFQPAECATLNSVSAIGTGSGSRNRKCRGNRKRQSNDEAIAADFTAAAAAASVANSTPFCYIRPSSSSMAAMAASPKSRWFARVVYQQSNDYPMRYTARTRSATSSPMSSPLAKPKTSQSCSLPSPYCSFGIESSYRDRETLLLPSPPQMPLSPPSPPPRNPNRKTVAAAAMTARNYSYPDRPSSYAFDANARQKEISSFIRGRRRRGDSYNYNYDDEEDDEDGDCGDDDCNDNFAVARYKSQSQVELRQPSRCNVFVDFGGRACQKNDDSCSVAALASTSLRSDIYINRNLFADEKPNAKPATSGRSQNARLFNSADRDGGCLSKANELGIPVMDAVTRGPTVTRPKKTTIDRRPLSAVPETSNGDVRSKPRNLEEALVELEEIYNSLKLSDDDLLDRADRRDLQAALKMRHPNRDYCEDDHDEDAADAYAGSPSRANRPRLPTSRRSAVPDAVTDDMAYRKLRRKNNGGSDAKSNPNLVSQSGSFLLMSPTLSPPPLVDVPPASPVPPFCPKEPDVTLDDVVFRNIRRVNNTLRVSDPQPPFGIPLSPVPAAPFSDYLHAIPSDKYRSTFNPSRVPDVVKDDLAFRSLRKDFRNESDFGVVGAAAPASSKKRRAVRSLSANVVSLLGERSTSDCIADTDDPAFDAASVLANDKHASYDHLPAGISEEWRRWQQPWQTNELEQHEGNSRCSDDRREDDVDETLDIVAEKTRALGEALEKKLRELETRAESQATSNNGVDRDVFAKRVVVHKPITLSAFKIGQVAVKEEKNARNEMIHHHGTDERPQLKLVKPLENVDSDTNRGNGKDIHCLREREQEWNCDDRDQVDVHIAEPCPDFNWNNVRIVNDELERRQRQQHQQHQQSQPSPAPLPLPSQQRADLKCDKTTENSSSGVSSTSNTPDLARKCRTTEDDASHASDREICDHDDDHLHHYHNHNRNHKRIRDRNDSDNNNDSDNLSKKVLPSFEYASKQCSQELRDAFECTDDVDAVKDVTVTSTATSAEAAFTHDDETRCTTEGTRAPVKKDFCSRFEITLVTPQPAGVDRTHKRWSSVETKDAAIMTEEFGLNGRIDCNNRSKVTSGETAQTRVARYKEERRKQLACQFHNQSPNVSDTWSSSSAIGDGFKRSSFRSVNPNSIKEDDVKSPKTQNNNKSTNKIRHRQSRVQCVADLKLKTNGSVTSDSTATTSSKSSRDKSSKRKSYLNRSANFEQTSNNCFSNRLHNYNLTDEGGDLNSRANVVAASSLPCQVADANCLAANTASTPPSSASSQKALSSPTYTIRSTGVVEKSSNNYSYSISNGFARSKETVDANVFKPIADDPLAVSDASDKSKIPRRIHHSVVSLSRSPTCSRQTLENKCSDDSFSEFRLNQIEAVTLDYIPCVRPSKGGLNNDDLCANEYELEDNATATEKEDDRMVSITLPSPTHNVTQKQKNSLLAIVHKFSDRNDVQNFSMHDGKHSLSSSTVVATAVTSQSPVPPSHSSSLEIIEEDSRSKPSILKKKFDARSNSLDSARPSSILKRNYFPEGGINGANNCVARAAGVSGGARAGSNLCAKQGILKKHSSLDEQEVRRRSCSPDVDIVHHQECKPILKSQRRRCSLEGFVRNGSPELHSILKRSKMTNEDCSDRNSSGGSPHGILKRKIFSRAAGTVSSSSSSTSSSSLSPPPPPPLLPLQLSGANSSSDLSSSSAGDRGSCDDPTVKPILKNYKQHSFELAAGVANDSFNLDSPRPILKKKHSVETDTDDDKPVKPILKSTARAASLDEDSSFAVRAETLPLENDNADAVALLKSKSVANARVFENLAIKPILKKKNNNNQSLFKSFRSVKSDEDVETSAVASSDYRDKREQNFAKRHSLPASSKQFGGYFASRAENGLSVAERIQNLENLRVDGQPFRTNEAFSIKKNYAGRNLRFSRNVERYKTQPITYQEIFSTESAMEDKTPLEGQQIDNITVVTGYEEASEHRVDEQSDPNDSFDVVQDQRDVCMLDDKAVISNLRRSNSVSMKTSLFTKWQNHVHQANESVKLKKHEKIAETRKLKTKYSDLASRFSTQPVTLEEVAEAKKQNQKARGKVDDSMRKETLAHVPENGEEIDEPSLMSLSERIKLFNRKMEQQRITLSKCPPKKSTSRFNTQPVTFEELRNAKIMTLHRNNGANEKTSSDAVPPSYKQKASPSPLSEDLLNVSVSFEKLRMDSSTESPSPQDVTISNLVGTDVSPNNDIDKLFDKIYLENSSETGSQSEGDTSSSGGREIRRIIGGCGKQSSPAEKRDKIVGITKMNIGPIVSATADSTNVDVVDDCPVINSNNSIAQRLAALQRSGQLDWKKRISRIVPENELPSITNINETQELLKKELTNGFRCGKSPTAETATTLIEDKKEGSLADRLEKLENASQTWKKRVEPSDAAQFSVAGKMATATTWSSTSTSTSTSSSSVNLTPNSADSPFFERKKRTPCLSRFRSFREKNATRSTPISPEKIKSTPSVLSRSLSLPSDGNDSDEANEIRHQDDDKVVSVPQIFDQDFCTFFGNVDAFLFNDSPNGLEFTSDFDDIKIEKPRLICNHNKGVRIRRKHATRGNPLKTLSTRIEIRNEYRETKTNAAEKELKRKNVEKIAKNANLAAEVLAGLASREDFSAVHLKKANTVLSGPLLPYKPLMLLHVKGRRHVQTRLVEPVPQSINSGDCYVLVTANEIYHWIGKLCNVIEKSRGAEIAQHILTTHDLGCSSASQVHTIIESSSELNSKVTRNFWMLLGVTAAEAVSMKAISSGHPDEDEIYENSLISTNMIFEIIDDELIPHEKYWASIPKIQMLDPNKVFVFDFGSEMYIWMGKNVDLTSRKSSVKLAEELWHNGYNYEECDLCPVTSVRTIGHRTTESDEANVTSNKSDKRPEWCLLAKVTQHMETVLFREKFLDWPDFSRVIRAKGTDEDTEKQIDGNLDIKPCNVEEMLSHKPTEPDLILEGSHLGRGIRYFDEERRKFCIITTSDVKMWHITEFESEEMARISFGQFYSTDSYVVRWNYSISYTGRELNGQPSKHTIVGRERCAYFCWQGKNASLNEQGAAALLTVELDKEKGVQLRICEGYEPPAFFNIFAGRTVIYKNRKEKKWKLFICKGETNSEACLLEVSCNIKQLRSRTSFVLLNVDTGILYIWHGSKVTKEASQTCLAIASNLKAKCPPEFGARNNTIVDILQIEEGKESKEFFIGLGRTSANTKLYLSLLQDERKYDTSPLLYNLSSNTGVFSATPIWSPCRHVQLTTAYPYLQEDLYSASQPAIFLLDTGEVLWLWQGWWPERQKLLQEEFAQGSEDVSQNSDNFRGSATVRWQLERRAAMQTALDYWKSKYPPNEPVKAFLVWAGLEPIQFTNLFPDWEDRDDVAEMNISDGRKPGEVLNVEQELARLTQSTYPVEQLLQRPLPDGVDPTKLELYLSAQHFKDILKLTKEEFSALPSWKQINLKKNAGLF